MNNPSQITLFKARFPVLFWAGIFFCFALFPFILLEAGLDRLLELRYNNIKSDRSVGLSRSLEFFANHIEPEKYFHWRLLEGLDLTAAAASPMSGLKQRLQALKDDFGNALSFVIWDENGEIVEELTDDSSFRYFIQRAYALFQLLSAEFLRVGFFSPDFIDSFSGEANFLRRYLGQFLVSGHLDYPFYDEETGSCIVSDVPGAKGMFWYRIYEPFSVLCFIDNSQFEPSDIAFRLVAAAKERFPEIRLGIFSAGEILCSSDFISSREFGILRVNLERYENLDPRPVLEQAEFFMSFRVLNDAYRGYAFFDESALFDVKNLKWGYLARFAAFAVIALFVVYCYSLINPLRKWSIRTRVIGLFAYSSLIPLLILLSLGFDYIHQIRQSLIAERLSRSFKLLHELDHSYTHYLEGLEKSIADFIHDDSTNILTMESELEAKFDTDINFLFHSSGNNLFKGTSALVRDTFILRHFALAVLGFIVSRDNSSISYHSLGAENVKNIRMQMFGKISAFGMLQQRLVYYQMPLIHPETAEISTFLILFWDQEKLEGKFLAEKQRLLRKLYPESSLIYYHPLSTRYFMPQNSIKPEVELRKLLANASRQKAISSSNLEQDGVRYIAAATLGSVIDSSVFAILTPVAEIDREILEITSNFAALAALALMFSLSLSQVIARHLLRPLKALKTSVDEIGRGNYSYRGNVIGATEFEVLGGALNGALENLKELEIARVVQESLFPESKFSQNQIQFYGRTSQMCKLGGDYFDYFAISDNKVGILIADAAGHGIPAALLMTAAKTATSLVCGSTEAGEDFLSAIHSALHALRSYGIKTMMTAIFVELDTLTGKGKIINCGHCYPMLVRRNGSELEYIRLAGVPLGVLRKVKYKTEEFELGHGDSLLLYSDGLLEAKDVSNEELGLDGFRSVVKESWADDMEVCHANIFARISGWAVEQTDDFTAMIIKRSSETVQHDS